VAEADISSRLARSLTLAPSKEEYGLLMPRASKEREAYAEGKGAGAGRSGVRLDLDVLGRSILDVDQFDGLNTTEQRRQCLELLEERFSQLGQEGHWEQRLECTTQHDSSSGWMLTKTRGLGSWWPNRRMRIYPRLAVRLDALTDARTWLTASGGALQTVLRAHNSARLWFFVHLTSVECLFSMTLP
jgi:hypothetical protein